jgi:hypothetical protein
VSCELVFFCSTKQVVGYKGGGIYWLAIHCNQANLMSDAYGTAAPIRHAKFDEKHAEQVLGNDSWHIMCPRLALQLPL